MKSLLVSSCLCFLCLAIFDKKSGILASDITPFIAFSTKSDKSKSTGFIGHSSTWIEALIYRTIKSKGNGMISTNLQSFDVDRISSTTLYFSFNSMETFNFGTLFSSFDQKEGSDVSQYQLRKSNTKEKRESKTKRPRKGLKSTRNNRGNRGSSFISSFIFPSTMTTLPRKRGRPRKAKSGDDDEGESDKLFFFFDKPTFFKGWKNNKTAREKKEKKRGRGRPRKVKKEDDDDEEKILFFFSKPKLPTFGLKIPVVSEYFEELNERWKGQIDLEKKMKKLEREVKKDKKSVNKAQINQYRFDILKSIESINDTGSIKGKSRNIDDIEKRVNRINPLDIKDGELFLEQKRLFNAKEDGRKSKDRSEQSKEEEIINPEDMDKILERESKKLNNIIAEEQRLVRLYTALFGGSAALLIWPTHDSFFAVIVGAGAMTYLTTTEGTLGDISRITGFLTLLIAKKIQNIEKKNAFLTNVGNTLKDAMVKSIPFDLPFVKKDPSNWRNWYQGEGFLHPDLRKPTHEELGDKDFFTSTSEYFYRNLFQSKSNLNDPKMRGESDKKALVDANEKEYQYIEYLREIKRWVDAEERAVVEKLRKKLQDQVEREIKQQENKEKFQQTVNSLLSTLTGGASIGSVVASINDLENLSWKDESQNMDENNKNKLKKENFNDSSLEEENNVYEEQLNEWNSRLKEKSNQKSQTSHDSETGEPMD